MRTAFRFIAFLIAILALGLAGPAPAGAAPRPILAAAKTPEPVLGTVYVFRPMGGQFASPEMDHLAIRIRERGLRAFVYNYVDWIRPANAAIARYKAETWKSPIILIGHSAGGDSTIRFAKWLQRSGVPVNLIITLDPTRIAGRVPSNVGRFINIYSSMNTLGGGDPQPAGDFKGHFVSVDLKNYPNLRHLYLPKVSGLQDRVVDKIVAVAEEQSVARGPGVRIEYQIPRGEPIVLWDTGMAVPIQSGDTAASIAARYGVPPWSVAELNHVDPSRPLKPGLQVIVPHNVDPASANP